jgi:hypothetical protein
VSLTSKLKSFLSSPKGQQLVDRGRRELSKPENQRKLRDLMDKRKR